MVGEAERWAPADFADVSFTVTRRASTSAAAAAEAGRAYAALEAALAPHDDAIERRTTESLRVAEVVRFEQETGRRYREGFSATRRLTVRFSPVVRAGAALRAAIAGDHELQVAGPTFGLRADNPVHAEVRSAAAAAARASAEAYASGVGLRLGPIRRIREPGTGVREPAGFAAQGRMLAADLVRGEEGAGVLVELTDEDVPVHAEVELEAELTEG